MIPNSSAEFYLTHRELIDKWFGLRDEAKQELAKALWAARLHWRSIVEQDPINSHSESRFKEWAGFSRPAIWGPRLPVVIALGWQEVSLLDSENRNHMWPYLGVLVPMHCQLDDDVRQGLLTALQDVRLLLEEEAWIGSRTLVPTSDSHGAGYAERTITPSELAEDFWAQFVENENNYSSIAKRLDDFAASLQTGP